MALMSWQRAVRAAERGLRIVRVAACGVCIATPEASAQAPRPDSARRWITSASAGLFGVEGYSDPEFLILGMQWTGAAHGRVVPDFALGTIPRTLAVGAVVLGGRAGLAFPLTLGSGTTLLPGGGLSAIGGAAPGAGGGTFGYNTGASLVMLGERGVGLRLGVTRHRFAWEGAVWLVEVGIARGPRPCSK